MRERFVQELTGLAVLVGGTVTALGASKGNFSFEFSSNVVGKTEFSLAAKKTTCKTTAGTYRYGTNVLLEDNYKYGMSLERAKIFGKSYSGDKYVRADGIQHTVSFDEIQKGKYTVNIGSQDNLSACGAIIKGVGELFQ